MPGAHGRPLMCVVFLSCLFVGLAASSCSSSDQTADGWSLDDDIPPETPALANCGGVLPERTVIAREVEGAGRQSIKLGPTGCPHLTYVQNPSDGPQQLQYVFWDGEDWQMEVVDEVGPRSSANALAIGDELGASVAYTVNEGEQLIYARRDQSGHWHSERVGDLYIGTLDHTIDPQGRPVIAAKTWPDRHTRDRAKLVYFYRNSDGWQREDVIADARRISGEHEIIFDDHGRPHIAAMIGDGRALYSYRTGNTSWRRAHVQFERPWPSIVSLALDADDRPHLLSCGIDAGAHHLYRHDTVWQREHISELGDSGYFCGGLALDAQNRLHALYGPNTAHRDREALFHATFDGDGWTEKRLGETARGTFQVDSHLGVIHVVALAEEPPSEEGAHARSDEVIYLSFPLDEQ